MIEEARRRLDVACSAGAGFGGDCSIGPAAEAVADHLHTGHSAAEAATGITRVNTQEAAGQLDVTGAGPEAAPGSSPPVTAEKAVPLPSAGRVGARVLPNRLLRRRFELRSDDNDFDRALRGTTHRR
ncbi:hypothetical protein BJI47_10525 [Rhodococcus sp. 1168]|nr:hypothetical protein BJI47_10525 [Rhodococcus sp. 1168]